MKVLLSSSSYPATESDWKGVFIRHQLDALARLGDLQLSSWAPPGPLPANVARATTKHDDEWLTGLMTRGGVAHLLRTRPLQGLRDAALLIRRMKAAFSRADADLYHVNWLQNALALPRDGRCALITALGTDLQLLRLPGMRGLIKRSLRGRAAAICANAEWMLPDLQRAFGDIALVSYVPFGIDNCWYSMERRFDGNTKPKWLCVSRLTVGKIGPLFEWVAPLFDGGRAELHLLGPMQEQIELPAWVHWHGPASPEELHSKWFPEAHGLITLSRHAEGRPQVMLEALASGLPIIASRLPAHDDLLRSGDGGVIVDSPQEALDALEVLALPMANRELGLRGRARMQAQIGTWDDCAARYVEIYHRLLELA